MKNKTSVEIYADLGELAAAAGDLFCRLAQAAIARRGVFTVALSGGSTPKSLYTLLATDERLRSSVPWAQIHCFFGDERHVPPAHADSNYRMVNEALFQRLAPVRPQIHRMLGELTDPAEAASRYESELRMMFEPHGLIEAGFPRFDLIFLGLGPDGHTASLFPGSRALLETHRWVVANWAEQLKTHRITLTFPVLNNARAVVLLVAGPAKAPIVASVLGREHTPPQYPVQRIIPNDGTQCWMLDQAAAAQLPRGIAPRQAKDPAS